MSNSLDAGFEFPMIETKPAMPTPDGMIDGPKEKELNTEMLMEDVKGEVVTEIENFSVKTEGFYEFCQNKRTDFKVSMMNKQNIDKYEFTFTQHSFDKWVNEYNRYYVEYFLASFYSCLALFNKVNNFVHKLEVTEDGIVFTITEKIRRGLNIEFNVKLNKVVYSKEDVLVEMVNEVKTSEEILKEQVKNLSEQLELSKKMIKNLNEQVNGFNEELTFVTDELTKFKMNVNTRMEKLEANQKQLGCEV